MDWVEMEGEMVCDQVLTNQVTDGRERNWTLTLDHTGETNLIEAARRGNISAFNQLVLDHQDDLYGWVSSLIWDEATAEDIVQQTFVTAFQKIHTFRDGSFRAWLFKIARNRSFDEMRYHRRHPVISLNNDPQDESAQDLLSTLPAPLLTPEETVIQLEQTRWLLRLLNDLPEPFRQALQLVDLYDMDYQEAAEILNLPLGTMKSRVARARLRLHDLIAQSSDECAFTKI